jgi:hypothetical protein
VRKARQPNEVLALPSASRSGMEIYARINPVNFRRICLFLVCLFAVGAVIELVLPNPPKAKPVAAPTPAAAPSPAPSAPPAAAAPAPPAVSDPVAAVPTPDAALAPAPDPAAQTAAAEPKVVIKQSLGEPGLADKVMALSQSLGKQAASGVDKQYGDHESRMEYWVIHPLTNAHRKLEPVMPFFGVALALFWIGLGIRRVGKKAGMRWWAVYWLAMVVLATAGPSMRDWNNSIYAVKGAAARMPLIHEDSKASSPDRVEAKVKNLVEIPRRLGVSQPLADMKFGKAGRQEPYARAVEDGRIEDHELPENAKVSSSRGQAFVALASLSWTGVWSVPIILTTHVAQVAEGYAQLLWVLLPFLLAAYCLFNTPRRIHERKHKSGPSLGMALRWWCLLVPLMLVVPMATSIITMVLLKIWDGASVGTSFASFGTWMVRLVVLAAIFGVGGYLAKCLQRDLRAKRDHGQLPLDGQVDVKALPRRGRKTLAPGAG